MKLATYGRGLDALGATMKSSLGPRGRVALRGFGDGIPMWDNHTSFIYGETVRYNERYWKATREVNPPLFPSFMSGDVPGDSDAWRPVGVSAVVRDQMQGLGRKGGQILGAIDIADWQRQMNTLKQVPVTVANVMVKYGQQAIDRAITQAKQPWYKSDLPGDIERANVKGKLDWHVNSLATTNAAIAQLRANPTAYGAKPGDADAQIYAPGDDLKTWVLRAFLDANAVEEGAAYLDAAWKQMWNEIRTELAKLPKEALKAVASAAGSAIEAATGVPMWGLILGGVALTAGVGYLGYKVLKTDMAKTYLGRR